MKLQLKYLKQALYAKLWNGRTWTFLLLQAFLIYLYMKPLVNFSEAVDYPVAPWAFPFLLSNLYFLFLFLLSIVYFFSDVPFMRYPEMYQIIRTGRRRWALGQIGSVIVQSLLILVFDFAVSILALAGRCEAIADWGKLLHTAAMTNAGQQFGFLFEMNYKTMQKFAPVELIVLTLLMGMLVVSLIGLMMFAISLFLGRVWAVLAGIGMAVSIYLVENDVTGHAKEIARFAPASWIRTEKIGIMEFEQYMLPSLPYMVTVLCTGLLVLSALIMWKMRHMELQWNKEE